MFIKSNISFDRTHKFEWLEFELAALSVQVNMNVLLSQLDLTVYIWAHIAIV